MNEPEAVITWETRPTPALAFTVNFGIFAGREASRRELERLAHVLLPIVPRLSIATEQRFEIGVDAAVTLHQIHVRSTTRPFPPTSPTSRPCEPGSPQRSSSGWRGA